MYLRVISRDTIDSLIGANLKAFRSYGGDEEADIETETFCGFDDLVDCTRRDGVLTGMPWKEEEESNKERFWGLVDREVRAAVMVAMVW